MTTPSGLKRSLRLAGLPVTPRLRRITAISLVAGPALFLVENLLHPKEYATGHEVEQLRSIAEASDRWYLAHALGFASTILLAPGLFGLAYLIGRRQPRLGVAIAALLVVGLMGVSFVWALDGTAWGALGAVSDERGVDRATLALALAELQGSSWIVPYYLVPVAWIAALLAIAVALARQRLASPPAAALLGLGAAMVVSETAIHDNAYFVVAAAVLLAGCVAVARAITDTWDWRLPGRGGGA